jgi:hypothetical protein
MKKSVQCTNVSFVHFCQLCIRPIIETEHLATDIRAQFTPFGSLYLNRPTFVMWTERERERDRERERERERMRAREREM